MAIHPGAPAAELERDDTALQDCGEGGINKTERDVKMIAPEERGSGGDARREGLQDDGGKGEGKDR